MSITTRTGDDGYTSLNYSRRVIKNHPAIKAVGAIDNLSVQLGRVRIALDEQILGHVSDVIRTIQLDLIELMGEVSTSPDEWDRYAGEHNPLGEADLKQLDTIVATLDPYMTKNQRGWAIPGDNPSTIELEQARVICREAETSVISLIEYYADASNAGCVIRVARMSVYLKTKGKRFSVTFKYLNRLSDVLWMIARVIEGPCNVREIFSNEITHKP